MDLVEYFNSNHKLGENSYYDEFYNTIYAEFEWEFEYSALDVDDFIQKWKAHLYPSNSYSKVSEVEFGLLSFWLYKNGFMVEGYPTMLSKIRTSGYFSDGDLKSATRQKFGSNGKMYGVAWTDRIQYVDELVVRRADISLLVIENDLEEIMMTVSPRNAQFAEMDLNEKLANIRDVFEHIGKSNGKYLVIPYESLSSNYISSRSVKDFANEIQCFRHGEQSLLEKRNSYTEAQKLFMIDFGLTILNMAYKYIKENKIS